MSLVSLAATVMVFGLFGPRPAVDSFGQVVPKAGVPRSDCFPVEKLSSEQRARAEELLLKAMDGEGLYTIVGGMKPMSSGWLSRSINVDVPKLEDAEADREVLEALKSGDEVFATLQPFWRVYENKRYLDGFFFNAPKVKEAIRRHSKFFGFYGVSPSSHPVEATMSFEVDATPQRNRGYGYLFGYPDHAVDFFVNAATQAKGKEIVPRAFLHIPVYAGEKHRFVYAVPQGHVPNVADLDLRQKALPVLEMYRRLRPKYVGEGKPGIARLLRDWFDDGTGRCSSQTALKKAIATSSVGQVP